ncbi:Prolipoprotein diacylglyceryl transferase [Syntrophomonas zehnderi OL-4]|uniref:Phosphatidylglycerol--prolipoprotein diacylglyceryl transferase n=1 Tax=Syntrophomonas zehnderi OL-4 TaxID=690567 RepID=A0A0E4GBL6_9FIRM|nr:prolipoprotein diacylglyceryl transferase [Syntrophomonas zehnderi]CFX90419.1 Prolipoprotein diacylglyceryl transferase [Syntrophomonas zehnderi OL-4]
MHPILFSWGKFNVYSWGFMLAVAIIVAIFGLTKMFKREGYDPNTAIDLVIILIITGVLGARLAYIVVYQWQDFLMNPAAVLIPGAEGFQGLIWYGALFIALPVFIWYVRRKNYPLWNMLDIFAPFVALGYAIVRIGCFLEGCCYGNVTNSALGVVFPTVDHLTRFPTQLFSSALNFILFALLIWYYPRRKFNGQIFIFYLMGYSVYRFIIEYFRDNIIFYGPFSMGQVVTLVIFGAALLLYRWRKEQSRWPEA